MPNHPNPKCEKTWPGVVICLLMVIGFGVLYMMAKTQIELEAATKMIQLPISKEARKD